MGLTLVKEFQTVDKFDAVRNLEHESNKHLFHLFDDPHDLYLAEVKSLTDLVKDGNFYFVFHREDERLKIEAIYNDNDDSSFYIFGKFENRSTPYTTKWLSFQSKLYFDIEFDSTTLLLEGWSMRKTSE